MTPSPFENVTGGDISPSSQGMSRVGRVPTRNTAERELEVAIYAARTSDKDAAEHYGMVRRTVSRIRNRWQDTPEFRIAKGRLAAKLADQYADIEQLAIDRARTAL